MRITNSVFMAASFWVAILLTILPLPYWVEGYRPVWLALILIYWVMALPQMISLGVAWSLGLLLDILNDALLGEHALALLSLAYLVSTFYQQLRMFPVWQQAMSVVFLVLCYQLTIALVQGMIGQPMPVPILIWPPMISGMLWPWVSMMLARRTKYFAVSLLH